MEVENRNPLFLKFLSCQPEKTTQQRLCVGSCLWLKQIKVNLVLQTMQFCICNNVINFHIILMVKKLRSLEAITVYVLPEVFTGEKIPSLL